MTTTGRRRTLARWLLTMLLSNLLVVFLWASDPFVEGGLLYWLTPLTGVFSLTDIPFWLLYGYLGLIDVIASLFALLLLPPDIRLRGRPPDKEARSN